MSPATLKQVNNLQVNRKGRLTASQPILVPGRGKAPVQVAAAAPSPASPQAKASAPAAPAPAAEKRSTAFYVVKAGDTLYGIARQFGRAVPDLLHLNNLSARAVIQPGLRLRVQ